MEKDAYWKALDAQSFQAAIIDLHLLDNYGMEVLLPSARIGNIYEENNTLSHNV